MLVQPVDPEDFIQPCMGKENWKLQKTYVRASLTANEYETNA
jgi:hypothetical protein